MSLSSSVTMPPPSENVELNTETQQSETLMDIIKLSIADEQKYKKMTELEHLLHRPDMYVGSIERISGNVCVLDRGHEDGKVLMKQSIIEYCPALLKIIDEAIVNILDHNWRMCTENVKTKKTKMAKAKKAAAMVKEVKNVRVSINEESHEVMIYNDGEGIDIAMHSKHNIYIPELIFAHFRTGTNLSLIHI